MNDADIIKVSDYGMYFDQVKKIYILPYRNYTYSKLQKNI